MRCAIHGCENSAENKLGIRLRKPDTTAIWAPETGAYLCDKHAVQGIQITIALEPTNTGEVRSLVNGGSTPIPHSMEITKSP